MNSKTAEVRSAGSDPHMSWSTPQEIKKELCPVLSFDKRLLPDSLGHWVEDIAERMQVPTDYPAIASILSLAGAVNRRARIQPKANDTGWIVVPNLWGAIVGRPGVMKSPVLKMATEPLMQVEQCWQKEHKEARWSHFRAIEELEASEASSKPNSNRRRRSASDKNSKTQAPTIKRLIANDPTPEALHELMSHNPAGIYVIRDELTGWLAGLERPGREGERALYLTAWNGDTSHTLDRIGRGTISVPGCCISLMGGIQPDLLLEYMKAQNLAADGLIQRFQLLVWPDTSNDYEYVDREPDHDAQSRMERLIQQLTSIDSEAPLVFRFAPDAQDLFVLWLTGLEMRLRDSSMSLLMLSHLSKYRSLMPSLALLLEMAERGSEAGFVGFAGYSSGDLLVSIENTVRAINLCKYLESHAERTYAYADQGRSQSPAKTLLERLKSTFERGRYFTAREVQQKGWQGLTNREAINRAIDFLMKLGWVRRAKTTMPGSQGGRPPQGYEINPALWRQ